MIRIGPLQVSVDRALIVLGDAPGQATLLRVPLEGPATVLACWQVASSDNRPGLNVAMVLM